MIIEKTVCCSMKRIAFLLIFVSSMSNLCAETVEEKLKSVGAWFLFSTRIEQQEGSDVLTQVDFFKKDDVSSILFESDNKLYSVFSDSGTDMNEDLWKMLGDNAFVLTDMAGTTTQIMEIIELSENKLVLRYCDDAVANNLKCVISTYFSTKAGWLSDTEIEELNSAGVIELKEVAP